VAAGDARERQGTLWVTETEPPYDGPRWFCHWDGAPAPDFDLPEEAVSWGCARAQTIVVRTIGTAVYWAGVRPAELDGEELRPWPPSPAERRKMDEAYEAAARAAKDDDAARRRYEQTREEWLATHAPGRVGQGPLHECLLLESEEDEFGIEFEELAPGATLFGARRQRAEARCFGSAETVIAAASGRAPTDAWVQAVCAALARERQWPLRRPRLAVESFNGQLFHVTAAVNRRSICRYGLDWRRMSEAHGIAGSPTPELPAIFLCEDREDAGFFVHMARVPVDIWAVRVDGLWLESGPDGWQLVAAPIEPERISLVATDIPPRDSE
jgi:hypothetical protein